MCLMSAVFGWTVGVQMYYNVSTYTCQFNRMTGTFQATKREVYGKSTLITVSVGDRVFMFPRDNITSCYKLTEEDLNEVPLPDSSD